MNLIVDLPKVDNFINGFKLVKKFFKKNLSYDIPNSLFPFLYVLFRGMM